MSRHELPNSAVEEIDVSNIQDDTIACFIKGLKAYKTLFGSIDVQFLRLTYLDGGDEVLINHSERIESLGPRGVTKKPPLYLELQKRISLPAWFQIPLLTIKYGKKTSMPGNSIKSNGVYLMPGRVYKWETFDKDIITWKKDHLSDAETLVGKPKFTPLTVPREATGLQPFIEKNALDRYIALGLHSVQFIDGEQT